MVKKRKVKALIFSPFFYPEAISTGKYNTHLAKALVRKGYSVDVIAFYPLYPEWKSKRTTASLKGVNIRRGGGFFVYSKSVILRRIQLELGFTVHTLWHIFFNRHSNIFIPIFAGFLFFKEKLLMVEWLCVTLIVTGAFLAIF